MHSPWPKVASTASSLCRKANNVDSIPSTFLRSVPILIPLGYWPEDGADGLWQRAQFNISRHVARSLMGADPFSISSSRSITAMIHSPCCDGSYRSVDHVGGHPSESIVIVILLWFPRVELAIGEPLVHVQPLLLFVVLLGQPFLLNIGIKPSLLADRPSRHSPNTV